MLWYNLLLFILTTYCALSGRVTIEPLLCEKIIVNCLDSVPLGICDFIMLSLVKVNVYINTLTSENSSSSKDMPNPSYVEIFMLWYVLD